MEKVQLIEAGEHSELVRLLLSQQSLVVLLVTFGGMLLFMFVEQIFPQRASDNVPVRRWLTNWLLALVNYFALFWFMSWVQSWPFLQASVAAAQLSNTLPPVLLLVLLIVSVELLAYWVHRAFHRVPVLWHIHAVHHMDTEVDATTSHRHHLFEVLSLAILITPLFVVVGAPMWAAFVYQIVRILITHFNHSNLRVPSSLDSMLRFLIVTPDFHRVHHSIQLPRTNSNYGTVTPWFDYLFGTAQPNMTPGEDTTVGLSYLSRKKDNRLDRIMLLPLFWRRWGIRGDS